MEPFLMCQLSVPWTLTPTYLSPVAVHVHPFMTTVYHLLSRIMHHVINSNHLKLEHHTEVPARCTPSNEPAECKLQDVNIFLLWTVNLRRQSCSEALKVLIVKSAASLKAQRGYDSEFFHLPSWSSLQSAEFTSAEFRPILTVMLNVWACVPYTSYIYYTLKCLHTVSLFEAQNQSLNVRVWLHV